MTLIATLEADVETCERGSSTTMSTSLHHVFTMQFAFPCMMPIGFDKGPLTIRAAVRDGIGPTPQDNRRPRFTVEVIDSNDPAHRISGLLDPSVIHIDQFRRAGFSGSLVLGLLEACARMMPFFSR